MYDALIKDIYAYPYEKTTITLILRERAQSPSGYPQSCQVTRLALFPFMRIAI